MNNSILSGVVVTSPQLRHTKDNLAIASFYLQFTVGKGQGKETTEERIEVLAFGNYAQVVKDQVAEGAKVILEGRLQIDSVEADGYKQKVAKFNASRIHDGYPTAIAPEPVPITTTPAPAPKAPPHAPTTPANLNEIPF